MIDPLPNNRVIEVAPKLTDWKAGGETGLTPLVTLPSSDWRPFKPTDEKQLMQATSPHYGFATYGDTDCCTNFSSTNVCEFALNLYVSLGLIPQPALDFLKGNNSMGLSYFDENGNVNFSDRFDGYVSKTDPAVGNSLPAVWQAKRDFGMVPEAAWPKPQAEWDALASQYPQTFKAPQDFWAVYFKAPPAAVLALGLEFRKFFEPQYEWVTYPGAPLSIAGFRAALQKGPLQLATAVCPGWNTDDPIKACGAGTQHATTMVAADSGEFYIYDHYSPFLKRFSPDYTITYAMRGILTLTTPPPPATFHYVFNTNLAFGNPNNPPFEVQQLQKALQFLKAQNGQPYMKPGVFGPFGPQTKVAFGLFQTEHGIQDPGGQGTNFGPKSRAAMNTALNG